MSTIQILPTTSTTSTSIKGSVSNAPIKPNMMMMMMMMSNMKSEGGTTNKKRRSSFTTTMPTTNITSSTASQQRQEDVLSILDECEDIVNATPATTPTSSSSLPICHPEVDAIKKSLDVDLIKSTTIEASLTRLLNIRFVDARNLSTEVRLELNMKGYPSNEMKVKVIEKAINIFYGETYNENKRQTMRKANETFTTIKKEKKQQSSSSSLHHNQNSSSSSSSSRRALSLSNNSNNSGSSSNHTSGNSTIIGKKKKSSSSNHNNSLRRSISVFK